MKDWQRVSVPPSATVKQAIGVIDSGSVQIALVVDASGRLCGTVTDGDVRRALLSGVPLEAQVGKVMHTAFASVAEGMDEQRILADMRRRQIRHMPVVDSEGKLTELLFLDEMLAMSGRPNKVVIMAGGLGTRLHPLTEDRPKPMLDIGGRPLLQTIIENFREQGFRHFYISINYLGEQIQDHFKDGSAWDCDIRYLQESQPLGTAGALSLLPIRPEQPMLVMNGDVLTRVDFKQLLEFHSATKSAATVCLRKYDVEVPYGVASLERHKVVELQEKPVQTLFVNAGIYVVEPRVLGKLEHGQYMDMPDLLRRVMADGEEIAGFPIHEYWLDVGRHEEYRRAVDEFDSVFHETVEAER